MAQKRFLITGKRWFQSTYGNTYHTATVYDLKTNNQYKSEIRYGYGSQYQETAKDLVKSKGIKVVPTFANSVFEVIDVKKKSEL